MSTQQDLAGGNVSQSLCVFEFSEDERLAELARQSERLAGTSETRSVELLEDDARYLVQENSELEAELQRWEAWYAGAPEAGDEGAHWASWYREAPNGRR